MSEIINEIPVTEQIQTEVAAPIEAAIVTSIEVEAIQPTEAPVPLCKGGCCPVASFDEDKITITDEGQTIVFTKDQAFCLAQELYANGFFKIIIS